MTNITKEQFEQKLVEQKINAIKWRELEEGQIYTIIGIEFIHTQYGEGCIIEIDDNQKVWAPSALAKRLKEENKPFPRYVRSVGLVQSQKNKSQKYYGFDLV